MRRALLAFLSSGIIQLAAVITGLLSARLLGPTGRGELASVISVTAVLAAVGLLSIGEATVFRTASAHDDHERDSVLTAALSVAAVLALVTVVAGVGVDHLVFRDRATMHDALLFLSFVPLNYIGLVLVASCQGRRSGLTWSLLRATPQTVNAASCVYLLFAHEGGQVRNFLLVQIVSNLVLIGMATGFLLAQKVSLRGVSLATVRGLLSFGLRMHPAAVGSAAREQLDRIVMTLILPAAALGQYAVAATLAVALMLVGVTVDMVAFPRIAGERDVAAKRTVFLRYARVGVTLIAGAGVALAMASQILIPILFGKAYVPAEAISPLLCLVYALAASKTVIGSGLKAANHPLKLGGAEMATLAIIVLLMPPMVLAYGPIGAAGAACVAQACSLVFVIHMAVRAFEVRARDILVVRTADVRFVFSRLIRA
jgi:O-antigen/teichoic acid export membrane protein